MTLLAFHGTAASFDGFRMRPSGLHFGTFDQAVHAATMKLGRLPLRDFSKLEPDPNGWRGRLLQCELQVHRILRVEDARTPSAWAALIRKHREHFDCLVYVNRYEGRQEADSFVVFDTNRVVVLNSDYTRSGIQPSD